MPSAPVGPCGPVAPLIPIVPFAPVAPCGPSAPGAPSVPFDPVAPCGSWGNMARLGACSSICGALGGPGGIFCVWGCICSFCKSDAPTLCGPEIINTDNNNSLKN